MNNIDLYIQELETAKVEIKEAIIAKGVTPEGGLSSYADAIDSITIPDPTFEELSIQLTENGTYNYNPTADGYSSVEVAVDVEIPTFETQIKDVTITSNGNVNIVPDSGFDGLSKVNISVEVAGSGGGTGKPKIYNGFVLNKQSGLPTNPSSNLANFDFSQYDWSSVYDLSYFFGNFSGPNWKNEDFANFDANFNGKMLAAEKIFNSTTSGILTFIPTFLRSRINQCVDTSYMFDSQTALTDTSEIANWNTSNVICMDYMFRGCNKMTSVPLFDTSNVLSMDSMFTDCSALTSVPLLDTSKVTNMLNMFSGCNKLTSVPHFDTSKVTSMSNMFRYCYALTTIPELDFSNVTSLGYMFNACSSLKELPNLNIKKVKSFDSNWMATKVEKIGIMDCDSVENAQYILTYVNDLTTLTNFGGFRNLGMKSNLTSTNGSYFISKIPNLTYDSLLNILNLLYDRASAGYSVLTIKLHPNHMALLSDDDKAIAINKGWSLTV